MVRRILALPKGNAVGFLERSEERERTPENKLMTFMKSRPWIVNKVNANHRHRFLGAIVPRSLRAEINKHCVQILPRWTM
jgi:hypothetical protein